MLRSFTPFVSFLSLVLTSGPATVLGHQGHGLSARDARSIDHALHSLSKRALDGYFVIDTEIGSEWGCSEAKIARLPQIINDAQALATIASAVLAEPDTEFSDAFVLWFGDTNSKADLRKTLKQSNYDSVLTYLKPPSANNRVTDMLMDNLSPNGLTYMCAAADNSMCSGGLVAGAHQHGAGGLSGHSIVLCDSFFEGVSNQEMLAFWQENRRLKGSSGFYLLHEVQHLATFVGDNRRCIDVPDPAYTDGSGCYNAGCCSRLAPKDKIQNAQNMAFFALEVMANPESGAPPGGSCTIMKRDNPDMLLGGAEDLMARSGYSPRDEYEAFLRRQAGPASTLSSMRRNATSSHPPSRSTSRRPSGEATPSGPPGDIPATPSRPATNKPATPSRSASEKPATPSGSASKPPGTASRPATDKPATPSRSASNAPAGTPSRPATKNPATPSRPASSNPAATPSRPAGDAPVFTTRPPASLVSSSGVSYSIYYSTAPPTTDEGGVPIIPIVPVPVPVPVVPVVPVVPPGGGGGGGGNDNPGNHPTKPAEPSAQPPAQPTSAPPTSEPEAPPTSPRPVSSATPCSSKAPLPAVPTGGNTPGDRDGFPQALYDDLKRKAAAPTTASPATSTVPPPPPPTSSDSFILETVGPLPTEPATPVQPVYCYNFNVNAYGYCCPGPDSPCKNDLGTCYCGGTGVSAGATNVVPDGATCPPPADAKT
ncbi:hypothetical protein CKAH01_07224 [Colletotrichum kahawae]|uniref:Uncharacterized protein n=1 Tax=Colletotrichum kahawae TaxID=34407 RepID=A0AAE0D3Q4_COLKA|nr:hypothetical protein CKAH01_07224 [Colletotrichum kahawae]